VSGASALQAPSAARPARAAARALERGARSTRRMPRVASPRLRHRAAAQRPRRHAGSGFDDADGWVKIAIEANGIYRLSRRRWPTRVSAWTRSIERLEALRRAAPAEVGWRTRLEDVSGHPGRDRRSGGGSPCTSAPTSRRVRSGTFSEIPILVNGESDGTFDTADAVIFYALGPDNYVTGSVSRAIRVRSTWRIPSRITRCTGSPGAGRFPKRPRHRVRRGRHHRPGRRW